MEMADLRTGTRSANPSRNILVMSAPRKHADFPYCTSRSSTLLKWDRFPSIQLVTFGSVGPRNESLSRRSTRGGNGTTTRKLRDRREFSLETSSASLNVARVLPCAIPSILDSRVGNVLRALQEISRYRGGASLNLARVPSHQVTLIPGHDPI
jgi:hypothetical protein